MPISQRMPSVMSLLSNSAMEDQACLVSKPWHCPGRMAGSGWNCLPITSYTVYTVITWVSYLTFGVESSSPLATSCLVHSACFQHETDQSRSFIASEVTTLWNSTGPYSPFCIWHKHEIWVYWPPQQKETSCWRSLFKEFWNDLETKCCALQTEKTIIPSLLPKTQESIILQEPILHSKSVSSESGCLIDSDCTPPHSATYDIYIYESSP